MNLRRSENDAARRVASPPTACQILSLRRAGEMKSPAFPSVATVELFRAALRALARLDAGTDDSPDRVAKPSNVSDSESSAAAELRSALQLICDDAREHALRAEQLLVVLKAAWPTLPEVRAIPVGVTRDGLLSRVLGLCLDEYYRDR